MTPTGSKHVASYLITFIVLWFWQLLTSFFLFLDLSLLKYIETSPGALPASKSVVPGPLFAGVNGLSVRRIIHLHLVPKFWTNGTIHPLHPCDLMVYIGTTLAQLDKALRYKPEGRGIDSSLCHWNFSLTYSFRPHYGPGVDSAFNRNEYREYFLGVKAADS